MPPAPAARPAYGYLEIDTQLDDRVSAIRIAGEVDLSNAERVEEALRDAEAGGSQVVLDISALEFLDSTGLRVLIEASQRSSQDGKRLRMRGATKQVKRILDISGVYERLPFEDRVDAFV